MTYIKLKALLRSVTVSLKKQITQNSQSQQTLFELDMEAINTAQPGGEEHQPPQKRIRLPTQRLECPSRDIPCSISVLLRPAYYGP